MTAEHTKGDLRTGSKSKSSGKIVLAAFVLMVTIFIAADVVRDQIPSSAQVTEEEQINTMPQTTESTESANIVNGITEIVPEIVTSKKSMAQIENPLKIKEGGVVSISTDGNTYRVGASFKPEEVPVVIWMDSSKTQGVKITSIGNNGFSAENIGDVPMEISFWGRFEDGDDLTPSTSTKIEPGESGIFRIGQANMFVITKIGAQVYFG